MTIQYVILETLALVKGWVKITKDSLVTLIAFKELIFYIM